jgi:hypothetical protein
MSGLFNEASLVLVPSGYKAGKVYSEVPTDGDGDLTFTRASSATRVNSDGLIESPRTNLLLRSEEFDNGVYTKVATTITSNTTNAPNGTLTADKLVSTSVSSSHSVYQNLGSVGDTRVISCFVKKAEYRYVTLQYGTAATRFDFDTLTFSGGTNNAYVDYGNGWYRISSLLTATINARVTITIPNNSGDISYVGDDVSGTFIWGAQAETGSTATEYIPTTTTARTTFAGITQDGTSASNVPRLDYSQGSCPALLLEPQKFNSVLYSEQFDNAYWTKANVTITANYAISPDGYTNADKFIPNTDNNTHVLSKTGFASNAYTFSIFAKADGETTFSMWILNNTVRALFDLSNGTILLSTVTSSKIEDYGNGWYRCSVYSSTAGTTASIYGRTGGAFIGNDSDGILFYGAQLEAGSYATSYIPTTSATVTRLADRVNRSGLGLTDSTFVINFRPLNGTVEVLDFQKSGGARMFYIAINSARFVTFNSVSGGTIGAIGSAITLNETCKLGFTLNASTSNVTVFINGLKIGTYATDITTFDRFRELETFGFAQGTKVEQILIFPSVLSDVDCEVLTGEIYTSYSEMATALGYTII